MGILSSLLVGIIANIASVYIVVNYVDGVSYTGGVMFFVIAGIVVWILNTFIKPLIKILSLPFVFFSAGLFLIVINGFLLWFLSYFLDILAFRDVALSFSNLGSYVIGAVVFGIVNWAISLITK